MGDVTLPAQLVQDVVDYLITKPWNESNGLIQAILQITRRPAVPPEIPSEDLPKP